MANQNFVVHNGLTVGALTIDAATSNVALPVGKQIQIGNVILRDNGDGRLAVRDATDNNDAIIVATIDAPSVTQGNIQIGTNHIESVNSNGPISLRPNGTGPLVFAANLISAGKGAAELTIATGLAMPTEYGVTYANANIILSPGRVGLYSGNVWVNQTTAASSTSTGALQVSGGVGVLGSLYVGGGIGAGGTVGSAGQVLQSTGSGIQWAQADQIANGGSNIRVTTDWVNVSVKGSNLLSVGSASTSVTGFLNVTGNIIATTAEVGSVEAAGVIYANSTVAATSSTTGTIITSGGLGVAQNSFFGANVTIQGNLFVNGNVSVFNTNNLSINDAMIYLADDNPADVLDIGFVSAFTSGAGYQHTGFVRDASDGLWKLFAGVVAEPTTTIDFTNATYSSLYVGNIQTVNSANIGSTLNVNGNILAKTATLGATTVNGATTLAGTVTVSSGFLNSSGNVIATGGVFNALTVNGATTQAGTLTVSSGFINSSGNVIATGGIFSSVNVNGNLTVTSAYAVPSANAASSLGSSATRWNFVYGVYGNFLSVNANYADLAEKYLADAEYAPGTVLEFGGDQEVTIAEEGTRRVAGVVSTNPGYLMNQGLEGEHTVELALTGRVPVKVTGYIRKGDMLVSAGEGRARASAMPQIGTVIGKALQDFDGSDGVIEVVVGRL